MTDTTTKPEGSTSHVEFMPVTPTADHGTYHHQKTTWYMMLFAVCVSMFGWLASFDSAFGGIVLLMDPYKKAFGQCSVAADGSETCSLNALQQSLVQLTLLFAAVGGGLSGIFGSYLGRKGTLQVGCLFIAIGAAGMIGSQGSFTNYMVCKSIGGIGMGCAYSAAPTWGAESVAPQKRGFLMSLYNVGLASGNVVAAAICGGSASIPNDWAWRIVIICQIPVCAILATVVLFFPESPRWLLTKGKVEQARISFAKFARADPDSAEIQWLVADSLRHIELERDMASKQSFSNIFKGTDLKRTHIAVLVLLGNALTGIQFVIPYTALFLSNVGLTNPYALNVAISSCVLAGTVPGPFLCEYVGRRRSLIYGYAVMAACMVTFAATASGLGQSSSTAQNVLVAFLCIWAFTFGATTGCVSFVASPEMHSIRLRTVAQSYAVVLYEISGFGAAFWTPYMLNASYGNMGTNVGYFYFSITVVFIILTAAFVPETGRLSLEEIDEYFLSGKPAWRTSLTQNKRIAAARNMQAGLGN